MTRHEELAQAERAIRELLRDHERDPMDVVGNLRDRGISELTIREAIWRLIDAGEVSLTRKRMLALGMVPA